MLKNTKSVHIFISYCFLNNFSDTSAHQKVKLFFTDVPYIPTLVNEKDVSFKQIKHQLKLGMHNK